MTFHFIKNITYLWIKNYNKFTSYNSMADFDPYSAP